MVQPAVITLMALIVHVLQVMKESFVKMKQMNVGVILVKTVQPALITWQDLIVHVLWVMKVSYVKMK